MEHAKVNGIQLQHEVVGSGEPMLFIHGAHIADALQPLPGQRPTRWRQRGLDPMQQPRACAPVGPGRALLPRRRPAVGGHGSAAAGVPLWRR
jgi:hypothetical protein